MRSGIVTDILHEEELGTGEGREEVKKGSHVSSCDLDYT
jgi:hypothetical protein